MAVINVVQYGQTTMASVDTVTNVTITGVDTAAAFLIFGQEFAGGVNQPNRMLVQGRLTSPTNIQFVRTATTAVGQFLTFNWFVPEFTSGVSVQRGELTLGATTNNLAIASVDTSQAFVLWTHAADDTSFSTDEFSHVKLTSATSIQAVVTAANAESGAYQVVEFTGAGASVQRGVEQFSGTTTASTVTITAINTTPSILLYNQTIAAGGGVAAAVAPLGHLLNGTTLEFLRSSTAGNRVIEMAWQVIEFLDGTGVQMGTAALATATAQNIAIAAVDTLRSIAFIAGDRNRGGLTNNGGADWGDNSWGRALFLGIDSIQVARFSADDTFTPAWFVAQFNTAAAEAAVVTDFSFVFSGF